MVGLGASGYTAMSYGAPGALAWPLSLVGFVGVAALAFFLVVKPLAKQQANSLHSRQSYLNQIARVEHTVPATGIGQVAFRDSTGARMLQPAISYEGQPLPRGSQALIIDVRPDGVVVVPFTLPELPKE